jgi:riboflavin kinase/FMN adenylyltransferase
LGEDLKGRAITLGNFDGVHLGHQALLRETQKIAEQDHLTSLALTYHPNPAIVLGKKNDFQYLMDLDARQAKIKSLGIQEVDVLPFTVELSQMEAETFLDSILLQKYQAKHIIIGFNHCFGKGRRGNFELLESLSKNNNFKVTVVKPIYFKEIKISSSLIRDFLKNGDIKNANSCLGANFSVTGKVIPGRKDGRKLGYPTANLDLTEEIVIPGKGVYATLTDGRPSMTNVGNKPTFGEESQSIETHILDYDNDLYGKILKLEFIHKIRDIEKFPNLEALIQELGRDEIATRKILSDLTK